MGRSRDRGTGRGESLTRGLRATAAESWHPVPKTPPGKAAAPGEAQWDTQPGHSTRASPKARPPPAPRVRWDAGGAEAVSSAPWRPQRCRREVQTRHLPGAAAINRVKKDESLSHGQARKEAARAELSGNPWVALGSLRGGTRTCQQQRAQCQGWGEEVTRWDGTQGLRNLAHPGGPHPHKLRAHSHPSLPISLVQSRNLRWGRRSGLSPKANLLHDPRHGSPLSPSLFLPQ